MSRPFTTRAYCHFITCLGIIWVSVNVHAFYLLYREQYVKALSNKNGPILKLHQYPWLTYR